MEWTHWQVSADDAANLKHTPAKEASESPGESRTSSSRQPGKLQLSDFELGKILGEGNYSRVFLGTLKESGQQVAVKVIEKKKLERYKKQAEALMEKHILSTCSHPFIIRLFHTFQDPTCLYLVTEYVPKGELWNYSHKTGLCLTLARFYAAEILDVLEYLHNQNVRSRARPAGAFPPVSDALFGGVQVVHRDVKPENVLIGRDGHIKLIDFGTAKIMGESARETSGNFKFGRVRSVGLGAPCAPPL